MKFLSLRPVLVLVLIFCFLSFIDRPIPQPSFPAIWKVSNNRLYPVERSLKGPVRDNIFSGNGLALQRLLNTQTPADRALDLKFNTMSDNPGTRYIANDKVSFFFNEKARHWMPLHKDSVDVAGQQMLSTTTQFTNMINGGLEVPEAPATLAFTPNTMSGITIPDATSEIVMISVPTANNTGSAALSYPIKIPAGRHGMQPDLAVQYNSDGGNNWMGLGWDLVAPAVSIETRWGVPRYNETLETETYTIDGGQLAPVAHRSDAVSRTSEKQFYPRVNNGFQKIIRHGSNPKNYWWEVTEKNGDRRFFGGNPRSGLDAAAVLPDANGNIGYWALTEARDLSENFVRYRYTKVADAGITGGAPGTNLYLASISYTGNGNSEGKYSVVFTRDRDLGEQKRQDITISARLGFKQVTADLLRKVDVKYNGVNVRSYELNYTPGAFTKTLLQTIKESDAAGVLFTTHTFDYYNDVQDAGGIYRPLAAAEQWNPRTDNVSGDFLNPITLFNDNASALSGNKSFGGAFDAAITIGLYDGQLTSKANTAGVKFGFNITGNEGMLALIDINGDGLADKVFKKDGKLSYRPNLSGPGNNPVFSPESRPINGIDNFNKGLSTSGNIGLESNFFVYAAFAYTHTDDVTSVYFSDVNADQLMDIVSNGTVYFNHLDNNGNPNFTTSSDVTPSPIRAAGAIDQALVTVDPQVLEKAIDDNPLHDVIKVWISPFNGVVNIAAPIQLLQNNTAEAQAYTAADGVRVAIQHKGNELWSTNINANDFTVKTPAGVNTVSVQKGDRIYFRTQSKFNGAYDQVIWTPQISYTNQTPGLNDANGLPIYQFNADKDYLLSAATSTGLNLGGTVHIEGDFKKPVTSDDVTVKVVKKAGGISTTLLEETFAWDQAITFPMSIDANVVKNDDLFFVVSSKTNTDWAALEWNPLVYYTASTDPKIPQVVDETGKYLIRFNPTVDFQAFTRTIQPSLAWTAPATKLFNIQAKPVLSDNIETGEIVFSIKKEKQLIAKQVILVTDGVLTSAPLLKLTFNSNDKLFFEYHTTNTKLAAAFVSPDVETEAGAADPKTVLAGLHTMDESFIYGPLYRHWGQFAYNGNRTRAGQPIIESELKLDESMMNPKSIDLSSAKNADEMQQMYVAEGGNQPRESKFIYLAPTNEKKLWIGYDEMTYVNKTTISSSRMGKDDLLPVNPIPSPNPGSGSGAAGIKKVSATDDVSFAIGEGVAVTGSIGSTKSLYDFTDMNGDGYPDILSNRKIQFTHPYGGLEAKAKDYSFQDLTLVNHNSVGVTAGGQLGLSSAPNASSTPKGASAGKAAVQSHGSAGISGQFNYNTDNEEFAFLDINGDGLSDRVYRDGQVELNLGYSFLLKEQWGYKGLSDGEAYTFGGGITVNIDHYSIAAGIGFSRTENQRKNSLQDMNGDGLPDYISGVSPLRVHINYGNGFGPEIIWSDEYAVNKGMSTGETVHIGFTIGITLIPILPIGKLCINPQITLSQGADRTKVEFNDIDGDGYPDYLESDKDTELKVARSTIKRTNRLKEVSRPLGGRFVLDYKRVGNTFDMPNSVWALASIDMYDGVNGDGPDKSTNTFDYQNGRYNRNEREFYGFGKLVVNNIDTENGDVVYRTIEEEFLNDNFYNKGLLKSEVLKDGNGNKFTETQNIYELKDIATGANLSDALSNADNGTAFPALVATDKLFYEGQPTAGKSTRSTFLYDVLGNITGSIDFGDPGPEDDVSTDITYHAVPARYLMNAPNTVTVTGSGQVYRQRASTINTTTGKVTELRQLLQSGDVARFNMTYDATGNLTSVTRPLNAADQRLKYTYEYDGEVKTYVTKVTDSYGYSSSSAYDVRFGQMLSATDLNGQQTQYTIDNSGRILTIREPLEIAAGKPFTISYEYHHDAEVPWAMAKHYDPAHPANFLETASFYDGFGREIQTKKDIALFTGKQVPDQEAMVVAGPSAFDAFGRTSVQFYPLTEAKGTTGEPNEESDNVDPHIMAYDVMDRLLTTKLPDQLIQKISYGFGNDRNGAMQFKTTSTDANDISTEKFINVRDLLKGTKRQYSQGSDVWTSYDYNPVNELVKVTDDQANVITMEYDQLGRKTSETHPDAGTTNFKHDLAGNLVEKTTANLQSDGTGIKYTYDHERMIKVTYPKNPQNNVTLTYGAPEETFFRAGRVSKQQDGSGTQQFFYNPLGDIVKNIRVINVPGVVPLTYTTEWTYDTWNRLTAMVYPDGEKLTYNYNLGGSLLNMTGVNSGTAFNYLTQLGYDKFEKRVYMSYGNGTEMTFAFSPERRKLANMSAKTSAGRVMMDNAYTWDNENQILKVMNAAPVPPSNLMGGKSEYHYTYDDMYRLTGSTGNFTGSNSENRFTLDMTYNTVSGILNKKQVHSKKGLDATDWVLRNHTSYNFDYKYNPGSKPNAPVKIGTEVFTYDANGNQTAWEDDRSAQNRQMEWDEENRIKTLSDNGYLTSYTYDASGTRVLKNVGNGQAVSINGKQVATSSGTGNYTIYVNPYQVVQTGGYTKHIFIEGQRIVSKLGASGKSGNNKDAFQFYYHPDHLGNSAFITDPKGEVYQHLEYFSFGETFVAEESNQHRTPYLYNAKELDDETGLYYYGARYYDPITSIWQGVDPSWGLPNQIGTSPYAYVQNNPITYVDPDGKFRYFSQGGIFGNNFLRLTAPGLPKMLGWIAENRNKDNSGLVLSGQRQNPNAIQPATEAGSLVIRNKMAGDDAAPRLNSAKGAKTGRNYYLTLNIFGKDVLSSAPPDAGPSAGEMQQEEMKKTFSAVQKAFVGSFMNKLGARKGKPTQKSTFYSILKAESAKRRQ